MNMFAFAAAAIDFLRFSTFLFAFFAIYFAAIDLRFPRYER